MFIPLDSDDSDGSEAASSGQDCADATMTSASSGPAASTFCPSHSHATLSSQRTRPPDCRVDASLDLMFVSPRLHAFADIRKTPSSSRRTGRSRVVSVTSVRTTWVGTGIAVPILGKLYCRIRNPAAMQSTRASRETIHLAFI